MKRIDVTQDQYDVLNEIVVPMLMRAKDERAAVAMMGLSLAYKFAQDLEPPLPSNVYPIVTHAGDDWSRRIGS
jgi:hypothetical protein